MNSTTEESQCLKDSSVNRQQVGAAVLLLLIFGSSRSSSLQLTSPTRFLSPSISGDKNGEKILVCFVKQKIISDPSPPLSI
jgi:hypothetical protein